MKYSKREAMSMAPAGWSYGGFWDGLYHFFYRKLGYGCINLQFGEEQLENGVLEKCCKRILDI